MSSGNPEGKLLGGICCTGGAEPERQTQQGLGKSMWRELKREGKGYISKGTRWKNSRQKCLVLSCYQVNALCAIVGRECWKWILFTWPWRRLGSKNNSWHGQGKRFLDSPMAQAKSQHSPSAPRAACELLQCLGPWNDPLSRACNETLGKHEPLPAAALKAGSLWGRCLSALTSPQSVQGRRPSPMGSWFSEGVGTQCPGRQQAAQWPELANQNGEREVWQVQLQERFPV